MAQYHPQGSFSRRVLVRLGRFFLLIAVLSWFGKSIHLWMFQYAYLSYEPLARVYLAARDGLYGLPETLTYVFAVVAHFIRQAHGALVSDLGYDPFAFPDFQQFTLSGVSSLPIGLGGGADAVLAGAVVVGGVLSLAQFAQLFVYSAAGGAIGWRYPGVPVIMTPFMSALFGFAGLGLAVWLTFTAFALHAVAGIIGALLGALLVRFPIGAGLPLWLLMIFGLHPQRIIRFPTLIIASLFNTVTDPSRGPKRSGGGGGGSQAGRSRSGARTKGGNQSRQRKEGLPSESGLDDRLGAACETFGLSIEEFMNPHFEQRQLVTRYRSLAKKLHPDAQGSERLMRLLNEDYEFLLANREGWSR